VHSLRLRRKPREQVRVATQPQANLCCSTEGPLVRLLPLAGEGEPMTSPAPEEAPRPVEHDHAAPTGGAVAEAGTEEIGARTTKPAGHADNADRILDVFVRVVDAADAVGEMQSAGFRRQPDRAYGLAETG
jgi:hypothetical protein